MVSNESSAWEQLLREARAGRRESLGVLLENYRQSLQLLAAAQVRQRLQARVNASDLVQEAFVRATEHFADFGGQTEGEWIGWLRTILRRCLLRAVQKQVQARRRSTLREIPIQQGSGSSSAGAAVPEALLISPGSSPSTGVQRQEAAAALAARLAQLPEPMRQVLVLRNLESLPFAEVAQRLGRTPGAVRILWLRALERLRQQPLSEDRS
jgi:RNA polymerase sigma-70 factor (ECF subfamily)